MSVSYKSYEIGKVCERKGDSFVMSRQEVGICLCITFYLQSLNLRGGPITQGAETGAACPGDCNSARRWSAAAEVDALISMSTVSAAVVALLFCSYCVVV